MEALDAPVGAVLADYYTDLYNDLFTDTPPTLPGKHQGRAWAFYVITLPYAVFAWVVVQRLCLYLGTSLGLAVGFPRKRSHNIGDSFREFVGMSTQSSIALVLLWSEPWVWDLSQWNYAVNEGTSFNTSKFPEDMGMRKSFAAYYPLEFGWYMGLLICMFIEYPRKSDYYIMATHHLVTMFLVAFSAIIGHTRIGVLVMLLHDTSDTLLHGSKILHYSLEGSRWHVLCDITFAIFAATFFITRLILYPYLLIQTFGVVPHVEVPVTLEEKSLLTALALLVFFHIYWFALIMKILKEAILGGEVQGDVRDDDEVDLQRKKAIGLVARKDTTKED